MKKREEKQQMIIEKARETFLDKGLFNTIMDDIANKVGLTRRTLYRYFETKEELAYETTIQLLNEWNDYQEGIFKELNGCGIEMLEVFLGRLIEYMIDKVNIMKYLGEFDFYFTDERDVKLSTDSMIRFNDIILTSEELITQIISLGQKDKSIKQDLDIKLTVMTISNVLWSFAQRIAIRGKLIKEESGFDGLTLIRNQVTMYIIAIKGD